MSHSTVSSSHFQGAWLTDVDDTLIPSGEHPTEAWIDDLVDFIRSLKAHDIAWVPVSGVDIVKMGPRLLYRLPEDVLTHVLYYGGEGSTKHYYDHRAHTWRVQADFRRDFSDAQALAILGQARFRRALSQRLQRSSDDQRIIERLKAANEVLADSRFGNPPCLIDELETQLAEAGFDPSQAETYFRGGAVSWMMLGDVSVEHYRAEAATQIRTQINQYLQQRMAELDYFQALGDAGIHMPYPHATRGIKLVRIGNDKGRAAEDLVATEGIPAARLLFTGNELYAGGNDDSVRRVQEMTILSVGAQQDPGVIQGGYHVAAMRHWMEWIASRLDTGKRWETTLAKLPSKARRASSRELIEVQCAVGATLSDWHAKHAQQLSTELLERLYQRHAGTFKQTRKKLIKTKRIQYALVHRLAVLEQYHYDRARKIVRSLLSSQVDAERMPELMQALQDSLLPELKELVSQVCVDQIGLKPKKVQRALEQLTHSDALPRVIERLLLSNGQAMEEIIVERNRILTMAEHWFTHIEKLVESYFKKRAAWQLQREAEEQALRHDPDVVTLSKKVPVEEIYRYLRWLIPRLDDFPHLKDLDKPTIVLIAGTSGVGKSTISQNLSKVMGIPTSFSSDVAARSVVRQSISFILGRETALGTYPELFGSSFAQPSLEWFYGHALLTMVGLEGIIDRLIKENVSAVIEGVALVPGTLPECYFERANIVWIVLGIPEQQTHLKRLTTRGETGVERGGAGRYQQQFATIRANHDRLLEMARLADVLVVENAGDLPAVLNQVQQRVADAYADRGLAIEDPLREQVAASLQERTTWEVHAPMRRRCEEAAADDSGEKKT